GCMGVHPRVRRECDEVHAMNEKVQAQSRLAYIDWMRGLACVLMFQWHCYNSWLAPEARQSLLYLWSRLGGTLPGPLFLFLPGVSFALVTEKLRERGADRESVAKTTIMRGAEIYGLGLLFRVQEFALGYPWSPWTDLLRVDVLNILGLSMMLMGALCWLTASFPQAESNNATVAENDPAKGNLASPASQVARSRQRGIAGAPATAAAIALLTPPLWTTFRPSWLPWPIES